MFDRTFSGELGPNFAQLKHIGGGGDGSIYSGFDRRFDFPVCIKRVSVTNKDDCRAALREIRIRRRIRHENILGLLNIVTSDGTQVCKISPANFHDTSCIYFVQELLDADLRQLIESNNRLSDDYVRLFFYQLLRGLKYIHSANVLHRDLKPSNVLVNVNSLELMISDFGHAIVLDPDFVHTSEQVSCNTSLWYKAPELILGSSRYSTASDMWAVGCILAEMLLGRPLFEGENDLEQLELIIHTIKMNGMDQAYVRKFLTDEVNEMYTGKPKFPLPSKFHKVDMQALHLLERLLTFDANDRVTAEMALTHPFLHELSCVADEPLCLKPLHVEHEVDDFLEYTLKDLIVGECMTLADEQPRIQMQMSSYSSLIDIVKELNYSPSQSASHSHDDNGSKSNVIIKITGDDGESIAEEDGRFKVLEVLKEEHTSSSDSTGVTSHEESVQEEPLVSDHAAMVSSYRFENEHHNKIDHHRRHSHHRRKTSAEESGNGLTPLMPHDERVGDGPLVSDQAAMLCSERWQTERHKVGHRRHHGHHRRKSKVTPPNKTHKSENLDSDGNQAAGRVSPESSTSDGGHPTKPTDSRSADETGPTPSSVGSVEDDKVENLINKSKRLLSDHLIVSGPEDVVQPEVAHDANGSAVLEGHGKLHNDDNELINGPNRLISEHAPANMAQGDPTRLENGKKLHDDDDVTELINRSNRLIAGLSPNDLPSSREAFDWLDMTKPKELAADRLATTHSVNNGTQNGAVNNKTILKPTARNNIRSLSELENDSRSELSVAELIRRSRELLDELVDDDEHEPAIESSVPKVTSESMVSDPSQVRESDRPMEEPRMSLNNLNTKTPHQNGFEWTLPWEPTPLAGDEVLEHEIDFDDLKKVVEKANELLQQSQESDHVVMNEKSLMGLEVANQVEETSQQNVDSTLGNHPGTDNVQEIVDLGNDSSETKQDVHSSAGVEEKPGGRLVNVDIFHYENIDICNRTCRHETPVLVDQQIIIFEYAVVKCFPEGEQPVLVKNTKLRPPKAPSGNQDNNDDGDRCDDDHDDGSDPATKPRPAKEGDGHRHSSRDRETETKSERVPHNSLGNTHTSARHRGTFAEQSRNDVFTSGLRSRDIIGSMNDYWEQGSPKLSTILGGTATRGRLRYSDRLEQRSPFQRHYQSDVARSSDTMNRREQDEKIDELGLMRTTMEPDKFNSKDIDTFCRNNCRATEKNARETHVGLLSSEDTGIKNFYDTIKINTLRAYRERLHEPYLF